MYKENKQSRLFQSFNRTTSYKKENIEKATTQGAISQVGVTGKSLEWMGVSVWLVGGMEESGCLEIELVGMGGVGRSETESVGV